MVTGGVLRALGLAATVVDAGEIMKKARPLVKMNSRQLEALADWERQHYGYEVGGLHVRAGGTPGADGLRQQQEADVIGSKKGI